MMTTPTYTFSHLEKDCIYNLTRDIPDPPVRADPFLNTRSIMTNPTSPFTDLDDEKKYWKDELGMRIPTSRAENPVVTDGGQASKRVSSIFSLLGSRAGQKYGIMRNIK